MGISTGRDPVISHMSDISTNSRSSIVVVEQRNLPTQHGNPGTLVLPSTSVTPTSLFQTQTHHLSSVVQSQPAVHTTLGGVAAQLAVHNASIPSVAAKAAEAVFGRAAVVHHGAAPIRDVRHGASDSWTAAAQVNQHPSHVPAPTPTSQFMPLNLQEALVQHQQQSPRLISNAIAQVRSSSIQEDASSSSTVMSEQHPSYSFQHMLQQKQHILMQQQHQEDHQRRIKEQREKERLSRERERQVRDHERQQREQQEHYQRYQQQQLLQQQQQLAAAQAAAQVQQAQVQQSVVAQQAPTVAPAGTAMFGNVARDVDAQQLNAANLDFYQHYAANIANFHPMYRN